MFILSTCLIKLTFFWELQLVVKISHFIAIAITYLNIRNYIMNQDYV